MARTNRVYSLAFKRQVALEFIGGATLSGLAKRHEIDRTLIRNWARKYEEGVCCERDRFIFLNGHGALSEMKVGPSKSACRSRFQTTTSCAG